MKIVIHSDSAVKDKYPSFYVLQTFKGLLEHKRMQTRITLVIHSSNESWFDGLVDLQTFIEAHQKLIKRILYVNKEPIPELASFIRSVGGVVENDVSILDNVNELSSYLEFLDSVAELEGETSDLLPSVENGVDLDSQLPALVNNLISSSEDLRTLNMLIDQLERADTEVFTPIMVETLRNTVTALSEGRLRTEHERNLYKQSLSSVVGSTADFKKKSAEINAQLQDNMAAFSNNMQKGLASRAGGVMYAPFTLDSTVRAKVVVIKEVKPTPYLTTFLTLFRRYMSTRSRGSLRTKLVILENNTGLLERRYKGVHRVTEDNLNTQRTLTADVVYTTRVLKDAVMKLFENSPGLVLILDRTQNVSPMVNGSGVKVVPVLQTVGDIERFSIDKRMPFLSLIALPTKTTHGVAIPFITFREDERDSEMKQNKIYSRYEENGLFKKFALLVEIDRE